MLSRPVVDLATRLAEITPAHIQSFIQPPHPLADLI
jgi:hypothetical protein